MNFMSSIPPADAVSAALCYSAVAISPGKRGWPAFDFSPNRATNQLVSPTSPSASKATRQCSTSFNLIDQTSNLRMFP